MTDTGACSLHERGLLREFGDGRKLVATGDALTTLVAMLNEQDLRAPVEVREDDAALRWDRRYPTMFSNVTRGEPQDYLRLSLSSRCVDGPADSDAYTLHLIALDDEGRSIGVAPLDAFCNPQTGLYDPRIRRVASMIEPLMAKLRDVLIRADGAMVNGRLRF